jgi:general L-amino acid transport system substrate-binding protein
MEMTKSILSTIAGAAVAMAAVQASAATLDDVKARGSVHCGVNSTGLLGFASRNDQGQWSGFDVDYCRAVSAAIFGDPDKVEYTPLNATERFEALKSGTVDILARNTTWTMARDTSMGMLFAGVSYYDGQGFMMRKSRMEETGVTKAEDLGGAEGEEGAKICVQTGTTTELNLGDFFNSRGLNYQPVIFETQDAADAAYASNGCDAYTTDVSGINSIRLKFPDAADHVVLPDVISKEPLGPVVRQGDDQWFNIVKWTHFALLNAEELGVTSANVEEMRAKAQKDVEEVAKDESYRREVSPEIARLLGVDGTFGEGIGLGNDWAFNIIKAVGNYGEMFERHLGASSPLKLSRGPNALWKDGGLQYAPPIR